MQVNSDNGLSNKNGLDFYQLWLRYVVYWPWFLVLFLLAVGGAWLYLHYATPIYAATARVLIKDESKGAEDSKEIEFLKIANSKKLIENESEVLGSKSLLQNVVLQLGLYAPVYTEGQFRDASAYTTSPIRIEVKEPEALTETDKIAFTYDKGRKTVNIGETRYPLGQWVALQNDTVRFLTNEKYDGTPGTDYYFTLVHPTNIGWFFKENLEVLPTSKVSTILQLTLEDEVAQRAEDVLNGLMTAYNEAALQDKNVMARNTLAFVEDRLKHVEQDLSSVESQIENYKTNTGSIDIGTQGGLFLKNVSDNDQKIGEINMQLAVLDQIEAYVLAKNNRASIVPSTVGINDPILSNLLNLLYNAELEYEKLKNTEGANSPSLTSLTNQIAKIRPGILENIESHRKTLAATRTNVQSTNQTYSSAIRTIPEKEKKLIDINRKRNIVSGIYTFLLQKREDLALSYAASIPNITVVDKAEASDYPVAPKRKKVYLFAFVIPFILGIGAVTMKETFTGKVLFRQEIETATVYPVIGEIVHNRSKKPIVVGKNERTFIAEQFRQLRVAISVNNKYNPRKKILVTSSIPSEGKSFVALNLALSFALTDKKIVLMELDINHPNISNKLDIPHSPGLADYLQGTVGPEKIIRQSALFDNLFVIPAGELSENSFSELLENGRIQRLLDYLGDLFDCVIIDAAPVNSITDAYILSPGCDLTLYVVRHKYTQKLFLARLDQNSHLKDVAIVFNDIHSRGFGKHHFGYGYGYGYSYRTASK
ncbi:polysaccharide biosynthesis tyrosine autokinase [Paraflavitalea sp. CAU 1676]|uniref:GumC family protein n=1 Tax=Paraflavitalea sp. CAU 1676 TaxID=3032598 RepID=UPI0023DAC799|nr:polysaccharide biosynthesis tyrosine autokinase [Paraflavitalea sp. CAU 1676]MDF2188451.1 GNVR domain-containing protein [Paraflavitalea sp. CAU 1676]